MLSLGQGIAKAAKLPLQYIKDNLKLYLDFKSNRSDTLAFPSEGSTYFSGSNQYIEIADNSDLDIAQGESLTFACWLNAEDTGTNEVIFSKKHSDLGYSITWHSSEKPVFYIKDSAGNDYYSYTSQVLSYNTWYHYAVVWNASTMKATHYVNGINAGITSEDDGTLVDASNSGVARIGIPADSTSYDFKGYLANMGIWKRVLSTEEINSVMNKSYSQLGSVEKTSLVMWQSLDSASNGVVQPATGEVLGNEEITKSVTDTWSGSGVTVNETSTEQAFSGTQSLKFTTGTGAGAKGVTSNTFTSVINALYKIDFWVYSPSSEDIEVYVAQGDGSGTSIGESIAIATNQWVNVVKYYNEVAGGASSSLKFANNSQSVTAYIDNISLKKVTSNTGFITGATTTTSVYGGNAPILPRAIDIAESQAEQIGNGSALFERANNDYIDCGNILNSSWCSSGDFTIAVWVYPITNTVNGGIVGIRGSSGTTLQLYLQNGFKFKSYNETGASGETSALTTNVWTHVAMVQDGSNKKFYFNGILDTTTSQNPSNAGASESFTIGFTGNPSSNENFDGKLSQLGAWAGALTAEQVRTLAQDVTSYAKIPADVKSTLGGELVDSNVASSWTDNSDSSTISNITGGVSIADDSSYSDLGKLNNAGLLSTDLTLGKLYKVQFDSYHNGTGTPSVRLKDGSANQVIDVTSSNTTYIRYILANTSVNEIMLRTQDNESGSVVYLTNVSIKEVTCDIVAFYPLDADSEVKGLSFDGTGDYVDCGANVHDFSSGDFTVTGWIYHDTANSHHAGIIGVRDSTNTEVQLYINSADNKLYSWNGSTNVSSTTAILDEVWTHVAMVQSGSNKKFYINGVLDNTASQSHGTARPATFKIGWTGSGSEEYQGKMSSISVYSVEKSATEIKAIYDDGIGGDESSNSSLVGYWKLDNASTVTDLSSNSNNGTVNNATLISAGTTDSVGNNDGGLY